MAVRCCRGAGGGATRRPIAHAEHFQRVAARVDRPDLAGAHACLVDVGDRLEGDLAAVVVGGGEFHGRPGLGVHQQPGTRAG